ncbi:MAG: hypothetical protein C5B53_02185, partial [Candidatus Melainabacteria bacterium]
MTNRFPAYQYILTAFFLSGLSSLILQVAWQRILNRYIGVALPSVAAVVVTTMAGLALGAIMAGYLIRKGRNGLDIYAVSQFLVALLGLAALLWQGQMEALISSLTAETTMTLPIVYTLRLFLLVLFLILPATLIGACYPALAHYLKERRALKEEAAWLYCFNLLGSALGAILGGFTLIPSLGIARTVLVASGFGFLAWLSLIPVLKSGEMGRLAKGILPDVAPLAMKTMVPFIAISFAGGALSMVLEVAFTRLFMLICGASSYAFASTLSCQLLALAVGGLFFTYCLVRPNQRMTDKQAYRILLILSGLAALSLYFSLFLIQVLPWAVFTGQSFLVNQLSASPTVAFLAVRILAAASIIFVPCLCLGGIFPTIVSLTSEREGDEQLLKLYLANLFGSVGGCLLAGFILLPHLARLFVSGIEMTLYLSVLAILFLSLYSAVKAGWMKTPQALISLAVLGAAGSICLPSWDRELLSRGVTFLPVGEKLLTPVQFRAFALAEKKAKRGGPFQNLFYREGLNSTVSVGSMSERNIIFLKTDGKTEATLPEDPALPAPESDIVSQILLGSLPVLICPLQTKSVLLIGLGSGATAGAILDSQEVEDLTVAELEEAVFEAQPYFARSNGHADEIFRGSKQSRLNKIAIDGRSLLSLTRKPYQVIVCQPGEPWLAGSAHLYTKEFWRLAKSRLEKGGVFCQWLQLYSIDKNNLDSLIGTFKAVFSETLVFRNARADELCLIGLNEDDQQNRNGAPGLLSLRQIEARLSEPSLKKTLIYIGVHSWPELLATLVLAPQSCRPPGDKDGELDPAKLNGDDRPL